MTSIIPAAMSNEGCCCSPGNPPAGCEALSDSCSDTITLGSFSLFAGWSTITYRPVAGCHTGSVVINDSYAAAFPSIVLTKPIDGNNPQYCGTGSAIVTVSAAGQDVGEFASCDEPCYTPGTFATCDAFDVSFDVDVPFSATVACIELDQAPPDMGCYTQPGVSDTHMLVLTISVAKYMHIDSWFAPETIQACTTCTGTFCDSEDICLGVRQSCFSFYCYAEDGCATGRTWLPLKWHAETMTNLDCARGTVQPSYPWAPCTVLCGAACASWRNPSHYSLGCQQLGETLNNASQIGCLNWRIYRVLTNSACYPITGCAYECAWEYSLSPVTGYTYDAADFQGSHTTISIT